MKAGNGFHDRFGPFNRRKQKGKQTETNGGPPQKKSSASSLPPHHFFIYRPHALHL